MSQDEEGISNNPINISQNISEDEEKGWKDGTWAIPQPAVGRRLLKFPDDTEVGVFGLDQIMADLYSEGKKADNETAEEVIRRLEAKNNYIPSSERVRREYAYVLLKEYRNYIKERSSNGW